NIRSRRGAGKFGSASQIPAFQLVAGAHQRLTPTGAGRFGGRRESENRLAIALGVRKDVTELLPRALLVLRFLPNRKVSSPRHRNVGGMAVRCNDQVGAKGLPLAHGRTCRFPDSAVSNDLGTVGTESDDCRAAAAFLDDPAGVLPHSVHA